jgi:hypothetical protein
MGSITIFARDWLSAYAHIADRRKPLSSAGSMVRFHTIPNGSGHARGSFSEVPRRSLDREGDERKDQGTPLARRASSAYLPLRAAALHHTRVSCGP